MNLLRLCMVSLMMVSAIGQLPPPDVLALLEFKKGIKHDPKGFVLDSWNEESIDFNGCPSTWNGIVCDGDKVAAVVLDNLHLSVDADLSVFANLSKLVKLSMANNSITGKLPSNIGDFRSLEDLDISDNHFSSSLPVAIGKLVSLRNFSLSGNNFDGPIPNAISGLSSIHVLDLSRNSLSGPLPTSLRRLTSLVSLNLSMNMFKEKIPKGFELLTQLEVLDLHGNKLDGDLDTEFLLITTSSHVDFSGNLLSTNTGRINFYLVFQRLLSF